MLQKLGKRNLTGWQMDATQLQKEGDSRYFQRKAGSWKGLRYDLGTISAILCNFYFLTNLIRGRDDAN